MIVKIINIPVDLKNLRPKIKVGDEFKVLYESKNPSTKKVCYFVESKDVKGIVVYKEEVEEVLN